MSIDPKLMAPAKDGIMLPARRRVMGLLESLPPEGREAYRLFNDAPAKKLYDEALVAGEKSSADEISQLRKVYQEYFISSIGDQAGNRLADDLFESGDFSGAQSIWKSILDAYPDTDLNPVQLQVKRGIALARAGRGDELRELIAQIRQTHPGATATIGGKDVDAAAYLASLVTPTTQPAPERTDNGAAIPLSLPASDSPRWQCEFIDKEVSQRIAERANNWGWQFMCDQMSNCVPATDTDGKRIYVNWLGACFAIDARTGKMLWRTDKFEEISQKVDQLLQSGPDINAYAALAIPDDRVLFVRVPIKRMNYDEPVRLTCHDTATGAQKWSSESGTLSNYEFLGKPAFINDAIYAPAKSRRGTDLSLLRIDPKNGRLLSSISLGQATGGTNFRGQPQVPECRLIAFEGKLYLLTNDGGICAIDPDTQEIDWAFQCNGPVVVDQQNFWQYRNMPHPVETPGVIAIHDGILYFKERRMDVMYAIDLGGPSLKWKRPVDDSDMIAGFFDNRVVTVGPDIGAIDLQSRALTWATRVPLDNGMLDPLLEGNTLLVFLGRGIYDIDTRSGALVRIFRGDDRDSIGGAVWRLGGNLITVSNQAITAYPLGTTARAN